MFGRIDAEKERDYVCCISSPGIPSAVSAIPTQISVAAITGARRTTGSTGATGSAAAAASIFMSFIDSSETGGCKNGQNQNNYDIPHLQLIFLQLITEIQICSRT